MSPQRKYFKSGIAELRDICNQNKENIEVLREVYDELCFRKTRAAVELRDKLEDYLDKNNSPKSSSKVAKANKPKTPRKASQKSAPPDTFGFDEPENFKYQKIFSLIDSPKNAKSQNTKWAIKRRSDEKYKLGIPEGADLLERQITALDKYILELRSTGKSNTYTTLHNGIRLNESPELNLYAFELEDPLEVFEGAKVEITIKNSQTEAKVSSLLDSTVILEFDSNQGKIIESCSIKIDRTQLLRALLEKLNDVKSGNLDSFNHSLVNKVFKNSSSPKEPELEKNVINIDELNDEQSLAIRHVLTNEVTYIWGPPGTGKTRTLGVLIENLFERDEKTLIASNTNQAVDQVLLKLCQHLGKDHEAVKEGYILRRGKIDLKELDEEWREFIDLDSIVEKKSEILVSQANEIQKKIDELNKKASEHEKVLSAFKSLEEKTNAHDRAVKAYNKILDNQQSNDNSIKTTQEKIKSLKLEEEERKSAGTLRRFVLRNQDQIERDISSNEDHLKSLKELKKDFPTQISKQINILDSFKEDLKIISAKVEGKDKAKVTKALEEIIKKRGPEEAKLSEIKSEIEKVKENVLESAKVVGATVTRTYLKQEEYTGFDNVVVDEASMVLLPSLYNVLGFASKKCVISGDFRQIAPIVQSNQEEIHDEISKDIFAFSGVEELSQKGRNTKNLIMLKKQYRMQGNICNLINSFMYRGELVTAQLEEPQTIVPDFFENIVIIDTSKIFPFSQKKNTSYYNLMHALAVRNLINIFNDQSEKNLSIGVCTPYTAQAKMHISLNSDHANVVSGTVHRFQGDEKDIMIIDTVDSLGDSQVGFWAMSDLPNEDGCKLWNVAISRAKDHLFFVGNLTHLNMHLPKGSFLRSLLYNAQNSGQIVPVDEILKISDPKNDLEPLIKKFELDDSTIEKGLFSNQDFEKVFFDDVKQAKKTVSIYSGFITPNRVAHYGDLFRSKIAEGVAIRCVTRPPKLNGSMKPQLGKEALDALESIGCIVDTRASIHQKAAIIDEKISWFGSLNPLSHTSATEETMARIANKNFASQLVQNLSIKFVKDTKGASVVKENPECEACNARTCFHFGTYGKPDYWRCEDCGSTKSVVNRGKKITDRSHSGKPCPEGCGGRMVIKSGRFGEFYSCSNFPKCKATLKT